MIDPEVGLNIVDLGLVYRVDIDPRRVIGEYDYAHPVFDLAALRAQHEVPSLQGRQHTWFCGAWTGYGFHEDGLKSGLAVARRLLMHAGTERAPMPLEALAA